MERGYISNINLPKEISNTKLNINLPETQRLKNINAPESPSFKDTMTQMAKDLNDSVNAPDQVLQDAISGNGADIHDAMIAMSKAELGINIATQVTTKVIQSYEKIMSIQV